MNTLLAALQLYLSTCDIGDFYEGVSVLNDRDFHVRTQAEIDIENAKANLALAQRRLACTEATKKMLDEYAKVKK